MRTSFGPLLGLALAFVATPALAEDAPAETPAVTVNGGATLVTDYRFRGLSQTNLHPAIQGSVTLSHKSGIYASAWSSSIDDYVAAGSDQEIDLILGYKKTFGGTTLDVGALYYLYPASKEFIPGYASDFVEPYVALSHTLGPVTAKATVNYAPKQRALSFANPKDDNLYGALDLSGSLGSSGMGLTAHLGHNFTKSFLSAGRKYTDWGVGATYTWKQMTVGVSYVDTNLPKNWATSLTGKDIGKAGIVASLGVSF
jgi:uncharacterized protein (TIGR02001 family)